MDRKLTEATTLVKRALRLLAEVQQEAEVQQDAKLAKLLSLMSRRKGTTLDEASKALGIQPHSVRSLISRKVRHGGYPVEVKDGHYRVDNH